MKHPINTLRDRLVAKCKENNAKYMSISFGDYIFTITDRGLFLYQEIENGWMGKQKPVSKNKEVGIHFFRNMAEIEKRFE